MEKKFVLNGNKLIAEFMGAKNFSISNNIEYCLYPCEISGETPNGFESQSIDGLNFHQSWDWLMPVVKKYWDYWNLQNSEPSYKMLPDKLDYRYDCLTIGIDSIETVFKQMVEFIKWYNKNVKKMKRQT